MKYPESILFIHQGTGLYGADKVLIMSIQAIIRKYPSIRITVFLPNQGLLSQTLLKEPQIEVVFKKMGILRKYDIKRGNLSALLRILLCFRHIKMLRAYDIVYINSLVIVDYILASRFTKKTTYIHIHEIIEGVARQIFNRLLDFNNAQLIFVSAAARDSIGSLKNAQHCVNWNGCKPMLTNASFPKQDNFLHLLLIGRISKRKGHFALIEALNMLSEEELKRIRLKIVGDVYGKNSKLTRELDEMIARYNLVAHIGFQPFTITPAHEFNIADVVVIPSVLPESFGLVAIEAMSVAKLVLAANHGGPAEIIEHGITGVLFEPGNNEDLAMKIREILNKPDMIQEIGKSGQQSYLKNFTEDAYIERLQNLL